jgi:hypothetical protein
MGARSAEQYIRTGCQRPIPLDTPDDASAAIRELVVAYSVAFAAALPKPVKP